MADWKTVRVFVSSTFRDMHLERDHLVRVVFPELKERCRTKHVQLVDVDLRWGVTEIDAEHGKALDICLDEIDSCRPYFIGILAHRYGFVPPGHLHSITAEEIYHGVLHGNVPRQVADLRAIIENKFEGHPLSKKQKACLVSCYLWDAQRGRYLLRDDVTPEESRTIRSAFKRCSVFQKDRSFFFFRSEALSRRLAGTNLSDFFEENQKNAKRLAKLKKDVVKARLSPSEYDDIESFGQSVLELLWKRIEAESVGGAAAGKTWFEEEAELHELFRSDRASGFVGRQDLLVRLEAFCKRGDGPQVLMVTGEPGCGKSALLAHFTNAMTQAHPEWSVLSHFVGASPSSTNLRLMLRRFCGSMYDSFDLEKLKQERLRDIDQDEEGARADRAAIEKEFTIPEDFQELINTFRDFIHKAPDSRQVIFVIDAVNQLEKAGNAPRMHWLPRECPANVRFVVGALPGEAADALRSRRSKPHEEVLEGLAPSEIRELADAYLRQISRRFPNPQIEESFFQKVEHGNPLYIVVALEELRVFGEFKELGKRVAELPETVSALFHQVLERIEGDFTASLVRDFMVYLACGRHGMRAEELQALLKSYAPRINGNPELSKLPDMIWARLYRAFRAYLFERSGVIDFFHGQLKEAVGRRYLENEADRDAAHNVIAGYFDDRWNEPYLRALDELTHQQTRAKDWTAVERTLCDLGFIEARCTAGMTYDLLRDYHEGLEALPESQAEDQRQPALEWRVEQYQQEMVAYARAWNEARKRHAADPETHPLPSPDDIPLPDIIRSIQPRIEIGDHWRRTSDRPARLNRIKAYAQFVRSESYSLAAFSFVPRFCLQQAAHFSGSGPVAESASEMLRTETKSILLLRREFQRTETNPDPILLMTLQAHTSFVDGVFISADGKQAVSSSRDETIRVWDLESGECQKQIRNSGSTGLYLGVTADGKRAFGGNDLGWLTVWDLENEECAASLRIHDGHILSIQVTPDGGRIVSGGQDRTVRVSDEEKEASFRTLTGHQDAVNCVSITPDGRLAVSGSSDRTVRVWNLDTAECLRTLEGHEGEVYGISVTPDGTIAMSGGSDRKVLVWDLTTGKCARTLTGHQDYVCCVVISPDGSRAISGSGLWAKDNTLRLWNVGTGECLGVLEGHTFQVNSVSVTPEFRLAVSGGSDHTVRVWDLQNGTPGTRTAEHLEAIDCYAFTSDGLKAVSGCKDQALRVWDPQTGACLKTIIGANSAFTVLSVAPNGKSVISGHSDSTLGIWDLKREEFSGILRGHTDSVYTLSITPDGTRAVSGDSGDGTLRVWDLKTGECLLTRKGHSQCVREICVSPEGRRALSVGFDKPIRVWDLENGQCLRSLEDQEDSGDAVWITPDGLRALSGGGAEIKVWDLQSGECLRVLANDGWPSNDLAITPDGRCAVSGDGDYSLRIWDLQSGQCLAKLDGHTQDVTRVSVTADGKLAFSLGWDKTLRVWDLHNRECVALYCAPDPIVSCSQIGASGSLAIGMPGRVVVLDLLNFEGSIPFVTAARIWQYARDGNPGRWQESITAVCPWCSLRFEVPIEVLAAASAASNGLVISSGASFDCLPSQAWEAPGLASACPSCEGRLRFNPFIVDLSDEANSEIGVRHTGLPEIRRGTVTKTLGSHDGRVTSIAMTVDGRYAVTSCEGGPTLMWDLVEEVQMPALSVHGSKVAALAISADGQQVVSAFTDGAVEAKHIAYDGLMWREKMDHPLAAVALACDGSLVLYATEDGSVYAWNIDHGTKEPVPVGHRGRILLLAVTPDGGRAAFVFGEGDLVVWDLFKRKGVMTVSRLHGVTALALTPDGRHLITAEDFIIRLWDLDDFAECLLTGHSARIEGLAFSADGRRFISVSQDGTMKVWDLEEQKEICTMIADRSCFSCVASPDGVRVVAGDEMGRVQWIRIHHRDAETGPPYTQEAHVTVDRVSNVVSKTAIDATPTGLDEERHPLGVSDEDSRSAEDAARPGAEALPVKRSELRRLWWADAFRIGFAVFLAWAAYRFTGLSPWRFVIIVPVYIGCFLLILASVSTKWANCPSCHDDTVVLPLKKQIRCSKCKRVLLIR